MCVEPHRPSDQMQFFCVFVCAHTSKTSLLALSRRTASVFFFLSSPESVYKNKRARGQGRKVIKNEINASTSTFSLFPQTREGEWVGGWVGRERRSSCSTLIKSAQSCQHTAHSTSTERRMNPLNHHGDQIKLTYFLNYQSVFAICFPTKRLILLLKSIMAAKYYKK
jgi:hypothetical protein